MIIKTKEVKADVKSWDNVKYPCIGISNVGHLVLFFKYGVGVKCKVTNNNIKNTVSVPAGYLMDKCIMKYYTPAPKGTMVSFEND